MAIHAQRKTLVESIGQQVRDLMSRSDRYLARDNFELRRLIRESEKLRAVNSFEGIISLLYLAEICGNVDGVRDLARQAANLHPDLKYEAEIQLAQSLVSLGLFSEAQSIYEEIAGPELARGNVRLGLGLMSGAVTRAHSLLELAKSMGIETNPDMAYTVETSYSVVKSTSTSDVQAAHLLDLAGEVLRSHRAVLAYGQPFLECIIHDEFQTLYVSMVVNVPIEEIGNMNLELADLVASRLHEIPEGVCVVFSGVPA